MNKQLLQTQDDFLRWCEWMERDTYTRPLAPDSYPCVVVWWIDTNEYSAKDYCQYEYVYREDWNQEQSVNQVYYDVYDKVTAKWAGCVRASSESHACKRAASKFGYAHEMLVATLRTV